MPTRRFSRDQTLSSHETLPCLDRRLSPDPATEVATTPRRFQDPPGGRRLPEPAGEPGHEVAAERMAAAGALAGGGPTPDAAATAATIAAAAPQAAPPATDDATTMRNEISALKFQKVGLVAIA